MNTPHDPRDPLDPHVHLDPHPAPDPDETVHDHPDDEEPGNKRVPILITAVTLFFILVFALVMLRRPPQEVLVTETPITYEELIRFSDIVPPQACMIRATGIDGYIAAVLARSPNASDLYLVEGESVRFVRKLPFPYMTAADKAANRPALTAAIANARAAP